MSVYLPVSDPPHVQLVLRLVYVQQREEEQEAAHFIPAPELI